MNYFIYCLKHYADFKGRARRKEYWMFVLFNAIFAIAAIILDNILGFNFRFSESGSSFPGTNYSFFEIKSPYGLITLLYGLAMVLPCLAVTTRRLHDIGKSGYWLLAYYVAVFVLWGFMMVALILALYSTVAMTITLLLFYLLLLALCITFLVFLCKDSQVGQNQYGENPKGINPLSE
ncbi:MAG: DUF805 domain-containing protein [Bacteroidales bacterium]|jgi:uncharacterized membrane protein YhaH (DUF805 family)|nr:DUF805 domain-containing protein [Bacteroidales bacterium]